MWELLPLFFHGFAVVVDAELLHSADSALDDQIQRRPFRVFICEQFRKVLHGGQLRLERPASVEADAALGCDAPVCQIRDDDLF